MGLLLKTVAPLQGATGSTQLPEVSAGASTSGYFLGSLPGCGFFLPKPLSQNSNRIVTSKLTLNCYSSFLDKEFFLLPDAQRQTGRVTSL